jgi:very-short-patch-repair endonuclease
LFWNRVRDRRLGGFKFRRQLEIGPYFADFACFERKLIVELDGSQHAEDAARVYDEQRTQFLEQNGWRVLRFWNNELQQNPDGVFQTILLALQPSS